jgi:hypothetical protein
LTKPKDKSFGLNGQPEPDYGRIRALAARITNADLNAIKTAVPDMAAIAGVPQDRREAFCFELEVLINEAHRRVMKRKYVQSMSSAKREALEEIEMAINALRRAFGKLGTGRARLAFNIELGLAYQRLDPGDHIGDLLPSLNARNILKPPVTTRAVAALAMASSALVNKNPNRRKGKGSVQDYNFQRLVGALWQCANEHGGALTANCKNNAGSGTMFRALEHLRPLFDTLVDGQGFIKSVLPAQTIANVVKAAREQARREDTGRPGT